MYGADGNKRGSEFQVNKYTNSHQIYPQIGVFNDNRFVIAWTSNIQDGYSGGIYGKIYNHDGTVFKEEF